MASRIALSILEHLRTRPGAPVLHFGTGTISAGDLADRIDRLSRGLRSLDRHGRIGIAMEAAPDTLALFIASLIAARETFVLDPSWPEATIAQVTASTGLDAVVAQMDAAPAGAIGAETLARMGADAQVPFSMDEDAAEPLFTLFTSGSTGMPKGCRRTETSWLRSFEADRALADLEGRGLVLVPGNLAHSLFLYAAVRGLWAGCAIALFPRFRPDRVLALADRFGDCAMFAVPTQLSALCAAAERRHPGVKRVLLTGSKLPSAVAGQARHTFPGAALIEFYGTTELSYVAARHVDANDPPTLVGTPLAGVDVMVVDDAGAPCPPGARGRVFVRSGMAFDGYVRNGRFEPAEASIGVGDAGWLDEEGNLHLDGRIDRMFQSSGRNIVPETIEAALAAVEGIEAAAVFGIPDPVREHRIVAVLKAPVASGRSAIVGGLKKSLPPYAIPGHYFECGDWPLTVSGKPDLVTLRERLDGGTLEPLA
ncbi:class I adenylate-forming enzyme family protein [Oceaniradius stylonematis]|uniref:class I adenylate-forming enzyme family protein n=1 Tax=Oceaniradius stylonematis TaxID=2184161 RepID=UPI00273F9E0F|nr:AMP-binding protein [Oceaniradius stylonematis]